VGLHLKRQGLQKVPYTGCTISSWTWVELTLIWVFHHLAQLPGHFCQIPIIPGRIGHSGTLKNQVNTTQVHEQLGNHVQLIWDPIFSCGAAERCVRCKFRRCNNYLFSSLSPTHHCFFTVHNTWLQDKLLHKVFCELTPLPTSTVKSVHAPLSSYHSFGIAPLEAHMSVGRSASAPQFDHSPK